MTLTGLDQKGSFTSAEVSSYCIYIPDLVSDLMSELNDLNNSIPTQEYVPKEEYIDHDCEPLNYLQQEARQWLCKHLHSEAAIYMLKVKDKEQRDIVAMPPSFSIEMDSLREKFAKYHKDYPDDFECYQASQRKD